MFALLAADSGIEPSMYRSWAKGQIGYMLGDNNKGLSYVIGYTDNYPKRPHHQDRYYLNTTFLPNHHNV